MKTIQINYDLRAPGRNYQPVYDYIKSYGTYAKPLESLWLVRTNKTVGQVRDDLTQLVDRNDKVLVFDVTGDAWASNYDDPHIQWMYGHMGILRAA
jgi:hypothetical protein